MPHIDPYVSCHIPQKGVEVSEMFARTLWVLQVCEGKELLSHKGSPEGWFLWALCPARRGTEGQQSGLIDEKYQFSRTTSWYLSLLLFIFNIGLIRHPQIISQKWPQKNNNFTSVPPLIHVFHSLHSGFFPFFTHSFPSSLSFSFYHAFIYLLNSSFLSFTSSFHLFTSVVSLSSILLHGLSPNRYSSSFPYLHFWFLRTFHCWYCLLLLQCKFQNAGDFLLGTRCCSTMVKYCSRICKYRHFCLSSQEKWELDVNTSSFTVNTFI